MGGSNMSATYEEPLEYKCDWCDAVATKFRSPSKNPEEPKFCEECFKEYLDRMGSDE
jgi:hypothetical protein